MSSIKLQAKTKRRRSSEAAARRGIQAGSYRLASAKSTMKKNRADGRTRSIARKLFIRSKKWVLNRLYQPLSSRSADVFLKFARGVCSNIVFKVFKWVWYSFHLASQPTFMICRAHVNPINGILIQCRRIYWDTHTGRELEQEDAIFPDAAVVKVDKAV